MWYVVRTRPLAVFEVKERMEQCGAQCYCPTVWRRVRPSKVRKPKKIPKPAFPGYFFLAADDVDALSNMPHRRYQILRMGSEEYLAISDDEVERLAKMERKWLEDSTTKSDLDFNVGDWVKVKGDETDLFGRMLVQRFVGRYVVVNMFNFETKADAKTLEKVA